MSRLIPCKRRDFIKKLRKLANATLLLSASGFSGLKNVQDGLLVGGQSLRMKGILGVVWLMR